MGAVDELLPQAMIDCFQVIISLCNFDNNEPLIYEIASFETCVYLVFVRDLVTFVLGCFITA